MNEIHTLTTGASIKINRPTSSTEKYMLYLHGGGFIYGSKNDLPNALLNCFLDTGYTVIGIDYLLTPNHSLKESLDSIEESFDEIKTTFNIEAPFSICGRSAGGYAANYLIHSLIQQNKARPQELVHFYGYYDLYFIQERTFTTEKNITLEMIKTIDQSQIIWDDPLMQRYLLYVYALQHQKLAEFYQLSDKNIDKFAIKPNILKQFPRTFNTASTTDDEIPFRYSKSLKRLVPETKFVPVYDLEHDFLKQPENTQVQNVFQKLRDWLN